jgi:hypothetical protein
MQVYSILVPCSNQHVSLYGAHNHPDHIVHHHDFVAFSPQANYTD